MAATVRGVLCLAFVLPLIHADTFSWVGGNMAFNTADNWANGFVPTGSNTPCSTTFGSDNTTVITQVPSDSFNFGEALILPANGALILSPDDTVLTFTDFGGSCGSSQPAVWIGGIAPNPKNDFYCHTNWHNDDTDSPADLPPCYQDVAVINAVTNPVKITVSPNVPMIALSDLQFSTPTGMIDVTNAKGNINQLEPQVDLYQLPNTTVYISSTGATKSVCEPLSQINPANGKCICYSSCPTPTMIATMQTNQKLLALQKYNITMSTIFTRPFTGTMNYQSLFVTPSQLQQNMANLTQVKVLIAAVNASVLPSIPAITMAVSSFTISADGMTVTMVGSVTGTAGNLFPPPLVPAANMPIIWNSTSVNSPSTSSLQQTTQLSLSSNMLTYISMQLQNTIANSVNTQNSAVRNATLLLLADATNVTASWNAVNANSCLNACTVGSTCTCPSLATDLVNSGMTSANATTVANAFILAKTTTSNWPTIVSNITNVVNAAAQASTVQQQQQQTVPSPVTLVGPTFNVYKPSDTILDQFLALNPASINFFKAYLTSQFNNYNGISSISNIVLGWTDYPAITIQFSYTINCLPSDAVCKTPMNLTSSYLYAPTLARLVQAYTNFLPRNPYCVCSSNCSQYRCSPTGLTSFCASCGGAAYCQAAPINYDMSTGTVFNNAWNLQFSSDEQNICIGFTTTTVTTTTRTTSTTVTTVTTAAGDGTAAASSGGGGGGGMAFAAAGAGGGILIIIIIVVILMRRKKAKQAAGPKRTEERTVVAFENPMYDDPKTSGGGSQPLYGGLEPDHEGLYDEPAFAHSAATKKANPIYSSHENLAEGYLEAGGRGGEGGYLDVSPGSQPAQDVGYLGTQTYEPPPEPQYAATDAGYLATQEPQYAATDAGYLASGAPEYADTYGFGME